MKVPKVLHDLWDAWSPQPLPPPPPPPPDYLPDDWRARAPMIEEQTLMRIIPDVIKPDLIDDLRRALLDAHIECRAVRDRNGIEDAAMTVHHLLATRHPGPWLQLVDAFEALDTMLTGYFMGGKYVLHSLGGAINARGAHNYSHEIHRDIRTYQREPLVLNTLVMLDDFTDLNGATWIGPRTPFRPGSESFFARATQAIGSAGSVLIFDSNCWHCGGENYTDAPRRSVTPMFCRPFIKPQFDYCRALGNRDDLSEYQRQVIGYNARVPASLDEWYRNGEERMYHADQG